MKTYNWATYGTGVIANQLAQAIAAAVLTPVMLFSPRQ